MRVMSEDRSWDMPRSTIRESGEGVEGCEESEEGWATEAVIEEDVRSSTQKWEPLEPS